MTAYLDGVGSPVRFKGTPGPAYTSVKCPPGHTVGRLSRSGCARRSGDKARNFRLRPAAGFDQRQSLCRRASKRFRHGAQPLAVAAAVGNRMHAPDIASSAATASDSGLAINPQRYE